MNRKQGARSSGNTTKEKSNKSQRTLGKAVLSVGPGMAAAVATALVAIWAARFIGEELFNFQSTPISSVMVALLLGIIVGNLVTLPSQLDEGLVFVSKKVLRVGVALLGLRLSIAQVAKVGAFAIPLVLVCVVGAFLIVTLLSRVLKISSTLGTLIAVGTSICGVSAIVATGPAIDANEEEISYAVTTITVFGMIALLIYPFVAGLIFSGNPSGVGYFLGTAVHDTSQVTGAALLYSQVYNAPLALEVALVTKLLRNLLMALVIPLVSVFHTRRTASSARFGGIGRYIPVFVLVFVGLSIVRTVGDFTMRDGGDAYGFLDVSKWQFLVSSTSTGAVFLLVMALAAVGFRTEVKRLFSLGLKPFLVGFAAAAAVGLLSIGTIRLLF